MPAETLLQRLFLDSQTAFIEAIDHVPNPGRGGAIGSLNPAGWTIAHLASVQDAWLSVFAAQQPSDPWLDEWFQRVRESGQTEANLPSVPDALAAFERVAERTSSYVSNWSWDELLEPATMPHDAHHSWQGESRAYLVARSIAHAFVHAGELSVLAALMARGDLGLPGALPQSSPPTAADDPSVPVVAALLRDAFEELRRIAVATPTPAARGAMDRVNPVSYTLGHVLHREDRLWSQVAQGREPDAALVAILPDGVPGEASPLPWGECLEALDSVEANVGRWLGALTPEAGATPMKWRDDSSYAAQVARSAVHVFSHAGEMMAHASLYGVADLGMPGRLAHVRAAAGSRPVA